MLSQTVLHRLRDWAKTSPDSKAQAFKTGQGHWSYVTAFEYLENVVSFSEYLRSEGYSKDEVGAIFSYNCKEWPQAELGLSLYGMKFVGLYPNAIGKECHYILNHTKSSILLVQNEEYFRRLTADGLGIPQTIKRVVVFEGPAQFSPIAVSFKDALEKGRKRLAEKGLSREVLFETTDTYLSKIDPLAPAFLIYTSGTTGNPKGAMLTHDNLAFTSDLVIKRWELPFQTGSLFSFLPMCHIAEQLHSVGVGISQRYLVYYCTKFDNVAVELAEAEPTLLLCVPRVWEKMMEKVQLTISKSPTLRKALANAALWSGGEKAKIRLGQTKPNALVNTAHGVFEKIVLSKVRKKMGLGKATLLASGAAPLPAHVSRWFRSLGLEILECYGMTESTGVISITLPGKDCAGTTGRPLEDCEFQLASDGEIMSKGRNIFMGYYQDPENTKATLENGWLKTGDLGEWTPDGYLRIVGRKREILKTSGGKMIAPVPIEEKLKEADFISQVCLVGDNRKFLSALITLSEGYLKELLDSKVPVENGFLQDGKVLDRVKAEITRVNGGLSNYEQVKKFAVLDREFSILEGEMTPTMKMKRNVIEKRFQNAIESFYN